MTMPDLSKFDGVTTVLVNIDQQEFVISFSVIPKCEGPIYLNSLAT